MALMIGCIWHGLDALQGTRAKPGNHLVIYNASTDLLTFNNSIQFSFISRHTYRHANRPAFGGTVTLFFYQMSHVLLNHGNVPVFVRSRIFLFARVRNL